MAILIMGKYAYVKSSITLYHKQADLSIAFIKFLKNIFQNCLSSGKRAKRKPLSKRDLHVRIAAILDYKLLQQSIKGCS